MTLKRTAAILFGFSVVACAGENVKVVSDFDGKRESIERMSTIIGEAASEGATLVRFPGGQWRWHAMTRLELPRKKKLEHTEFETAAIDLSASIREWITTHKVRAVQIAIDKDAPAEVFFKIERLLTGMSVPYALVGGTEVGRGRMLVHETDGRARSIPLDEPSGEQGGAPNRLPTVCLTVARSFGSVLVLATFACGGRIDGLKCSA